MAQTEANIFAYATFNLAGLLQLARNLRHVACWCDESRRPARGSFNWVIFVTFEDGVEWVFRSPTKSHYGLQGHVAGEVLANEVATLNFLRETSDIPVPEVFSYWYVREMSRYRSRLS